MRTARFPQPVRVICKILHESEKDHIITNSSRLSSPRQLIETTLMCLLFAVNPASVVHHVPLSL